jgi:hypothetical protein
MVQYRTEYQRNPGPADAAKLANYVARGDVGRVERAAGVRATPADVDGFQRIATNAEMTRLHSFTFLEDRTPEELTAGVRDVLQERLDGTYLVGVDVANDGNNHLHVAEAGDREELFMDRADIAEFREAIGERFDEDLADRQVRA